jgi:flagellar motor switch/type III secretory pathway protein FliN
MKTMDGEEAEQLCLDQLVTMNQPVDHPVRVFLDGKLCARGILVTLNGHFGIRITGLEEPATAESQ